MEEKQFIRGICWSALFLFTHNDEPTLAKELLKEAGYKQSWNNYLDKPEKEMLKTLNL